MLRSAAAALSLVVCYVSSIHRRGDSTVSLVDIKNEPHAAAAVGVASCDAGDAGDDKVAVGSEVTTRPQAVLTWAMRRRYWHRQR